jgi:hypothetical protein
MRKKILAGLAVVLVVFAVGVATRPATYRLEHQAVVPASSSTVYALLSGYGRLPEWSPWQKLDPAMKGTLSGPATGVGAAYHWDGNDKAGAGTMTITAVTPDTRIEQEVRFERPFPSVAQQTFDLQADGAGKTRVVWTMSGDNSFFAKVMQLFVSMDDLIGKDLDEGLANLAPLAAAEQKKLGDAAAAAAALAPAAATPDAAAPPAPTAPASH